MITEPFQIKPSNYKNHKLFFTKSHKAIKEPEINKELNERQKPTESIKNVRRKNFRVKNDQSDNTDGQKNKNQLLFPQQEESMILRALERKMFLKYVK